jgi:hypothetical protein
MSPISTRRGDVEHKRCKDRQGYTYRADKGQAEKAPDETYD